MPNVYPITAEITSEQSKLLADLVRRYKAKSILEIGTLYGSSAKILADAAGVGGNVITIERMRENYEIALQNLSDYLNIQLIHADAIEYLPKINQKFDLIFIDANKSKYPFYLEQSIRLIADGGIIVADNTDFRGMVLNGANPIKRYGAIVRGLRDFHQMAAQLENCKVEQIDIEDGMTVIRACRHIARDR